MRFGVVLGKEGGALSLMLLPYRLFVGGTVGAGEQWVSWIHGRCCPSYRFVINNPNLRGPKCHCSHPSSDQYFGKTISSILHRPHWLPVPSLS